MGICVFGSRIEIGKLCSMQDHIRAASGPLTSVQGVPALGTVSF